MIFTYNLTVVTLPANKFGVPYPEFENHTIQIVATDGQVTCYQGLYTEIFISVRLKLKEAQRAELRDFFMDTVKWGLLPFTVTPDSGIDIGNGAGVELGDVYYWGKSYAEIPIACGIWEVSFLLRGLVPIGGP